MATENQAAADSTAIKVRVEAAGGIDGYAKVLTADTMKRWNGQPSQTVLGGTGVPCRSSKATDRGASHRTGAEIGARLCHP